MAHSVAVRPANGRRTWTVIDEKYRTVAPVEDWLEAHRQLWSPNTVRGYATSLAQWWTFLEQRDETGRWGDLGVPAVAGFLSWLRNGRTVEHTLIEPEQAPDPGTLEARLAALISFYRWQEAVFSVPVAGGSCAGHRAGPRPGACSRTWTPGLLPLRPRWSGSGASGSAVALRCFCPPRSRRSWTAARCRTPRSVTGGGTCATGCCSHCSRRPGCAWARPLACGSATS